METKTISVQGKGDYVIELDAGSIRVLFEGRVLFLAKGDPSKMGKPPFASIEEAEDYFNKTDHATPILPPPADEEPAN